MVSPQAIPSRPYLCSFLIRVTQSLCSVLQKFRANALKQVLNISASSLLLYRDRNTSPDLATRKWQPLKNTTTLSSLYVSHYFKLEIMYKLNKTSHGRAMIEKRSCG